MIIDPRLSQAAQTGQAPPFAPRGAPSSRQSGEVVPLHGIPYHAISNSLNASRYASLVAATRACLVKGEACFRHCVGQLNKGDTSLVDCLKTVSGMLPICRALERHGSIGAKHIRESATLCSAVTSECEAECRNHAEHHVACKECAKACAACIDECGKITENLPVLRFCTADSD